MTTQYGPSFVAAKLYKKTGAKGQEYFVGRLGGVKVALLKSRETSEDGSEIWSLMFSEAAPYKPRDEVKADSQAPITTLAPPPDRPPSRQRAQGPDDEVPF